jgi:hypothetical protein
MAKTTLVDDEDLVEEEGAFTQEDFKDLAKTYLCLFFKRKKDVNGLEIEREDLLTDRNISMVLNFDICEGSRLIYDALSPLYGKEIQKRKGKVPLDILMFLKLLNECAKMSVPKCFAAGLVAVYVEICKGCKVSV